jgi:hypothetical protein
MATVMDLATETVRAMVTDSVMGMETAMGSHQSQ